MKKISLFLLLIIFPLIISGCFGEKQNDMDVPTLEGTYKYSNVDFKFSLVLPSEFEYYQTQRLNGDDYTDIEFFVPTSDLDYPQDVPSYAKPFVIRIYDKGAWDDGRSDFQKIDETKNQVYAIQFWEREPKDWQDKWNVEMKNNILNSFELK